MLVDIIEEGGSLYFKDSSGYKAYLCVAPSTSLQEANPRLSLTPEEIVELSKAGIRPDDIVKLRKEGLL